MNNNNSLLNKIISALYSGKTTSIGNRVFNNATTPTYINKNVDEVYGTRYGKILINVTGATSYDKACDEGFKLIVQRRNRMSNRWHIVVLDNSIVYVDGMCCILPETYNSAESAKEAILDILDK